MNEHYCSFEQQPVRMCRFIHNEAIVDDSDKDNDRTDVADLFVAKFYESDHVIL